jgi:signal transduction histidine kinase
MPISESPLLIKQKLPWWTWVIGLGILHLGSQISVQFKIDDGISAIYLPTAFGIVMVNWWGPWRVVPMVYLNAVISSFLWDIPEIQNWFLFSLPETLMVWCSWYFFSLVNGKYWLPDIKHLLFFLLLGIILPIIPELLTLQILFVALGSHQVENFGFEFIRNCLGEFTSSFGISLLLLYYVSPIISRYDLLLFPIKLRSRTLELTRSQWMEVIFLAILLLVLVFTIEFRRYWFVYGVFSLYAAIRFGFGIAVLTNFYIYLITYIFPSLFPSYGYMDLKTDKDIVEIFLGISVLYVFAAVAGRVISDLVSIERKLKGRNEELEVANAEMDRFVYSVSHDLSAPLKSILGLVNVSKFDLAASKEYFTKIEKSVNKMEAFINEILDYSRNKRLNITLEQIKLKELCTEILDNLKYTDGFQAIQFDFSGIEQNEILTDRTRIKIILNNLLSNAIKYQKNVSDHQPQIKISSYKIDSKLVVEIQDNGDGIKPEFQPRIFDMFYRGTEKSKGSGLGLYIAKETAEKLNATLMMNSTYGSGSTFSLLLN